MSLSNSALDIVFIGLAVTSSWGNGHATTYRSLIKGLGLRGHRVTFLEKDQPWYARNRDQPRPAHCTTHLYSDARDLTARFAASIHHADAVIVGSYVDDGRRVCDWVLQTARGVRAFYDIDTPVTLRTVREDTCEYLGASQIREFDLLLSFAGGPTLRALEARYGARRPVPLYCSVDPDIYTPQRGTRRVALGYMGTYSDDRQFGVEAFLNEPARSLPEERFMVVGAQYPRSLEWPANVHRREHLAPNRHSRFYASQRFTLNLTRADMRAAGYSPSVRLFEAAACGTPIISDAWAGLEEVFVPREEVLVARRTADVVEYLSELDEAQRMRIAASARERTLAEHSGVHRAQQLEAYIEQAAHRHRDNLARAATG